MIIAEFKNDKTKTYTQSAYQYDKGQTLMISGISLPETFEVHMSNQKEHGVAYAVEGTSESISIPNDLFENGEYIYVWICQSDEDPDLKHTSYEIVIPVIRRSEATDWL